ncbi:MAG TPA: DUF2252 domain-containing protein [Candidatus Limnocylindrales bacterium]|nr:DUF2252 domain-containing protein [Candidatus Limnocylindrales bacterium]
MPSELRALTSDTRSLAERYAAGKALRNAIPRSSHGEFTPAPDRPDVVDLVTAQDVRRIESLLPVKYGRMTTSPFAFYRGSAGVMAFDLSTTPSTTLIAQLCGDAHVSNFGVFASPERHLVFDINDFDETHLGSWEWDLKRLVASAVIAGRENGFSESSCRELAMTTASLYRAAMQRASEMNVLDLWYYHVDTDMILSIQNLVQVTRSKQMEAVLKKAQARTQRRSLDKMTEIVDSERRFRSEPPLLVPAHELEDEEKVIKMLTNAWAGYTDSLPDERRRLLERFRIVDAARRVGGVGSVGTRCTVTLLQGSSVDDCIVLQQKEVGPSVLEAYFQKHPYANDAERVVRGQRAIQATPDIFLGWHKGPEKNVRYYYWRQLADMKGSADISLLDEAAFKGYLSVCAVCVARAHARTGDPAEIAGYIGRSDVLAEAMTKFAFTYADQAQRDFEAMTKAVKSGRLTVETGV